MAFALRSNRVSRLLLFLMIALPLLVPRFFFPFFFYSHVMSNRATGDRAKDGVMVHEMSGNCADRRAFEATGGFRGRNTGQRKAGGDRGDNDMFHDNGSHMSV